MTGTPSRQRTIMRPHDDSSWGEEAKTQASSRPAASTSTPAATATPPTTMVVRLASVQPCPDCDGILRPEVVLFGEMLQEEKYWRLAKEIEKGFDVVFSIVLPIGAWSNSRRPMGVKKPSPFLMMQPTGHVSSAIALSSRWTFVCARFSPFTPTRL